MSRNTSRWSKEDCKYLKENLHQTVDELSKNLQRTKNAIQKKLWNHKLIAKRKSHKLPWSSNDIKYLVDNYSKITWNKLIKNLHRSGFCIHEKLKQLNLTRKTLKKPPWTDEEDKKLMDLYQSGLDYEEIGKVIDRTQYAMKTRMKNLFRHEKKILPLRLFFKSNNFYLSLKKSIRNYTSKSECCLCSYNIFVDLHHIDGNRENNNIDNIASLCPNCHREVEMGLHKNEYLCCIWWRINYNGTLSEKIDNKKYIDNVVIQKSIPIKKDDGRLHPYKSR